MTSDVFAWQLTLACYNSLSYNCRGAMAGEDTLQTEAMPKYSPVQDFDRMLIT